ncbi:MAG: hypothetical protein ABIJ86_12025 [Spirochaetota bacterium]
MQAGIFEIITTRLDVLPIPAWVFFLAARYIDTGYEALHFGQINIMDANDPGHVYWLELLGRVRAYTASHTRRRFVLCDAQVRKKPSNRSGINIILQEMANTCSRQPQTQKKVE